MSPSSLPIRDVSGEEEDVANEKKSKRDPLVELHPVSREEGEGELGDASIHATKGGVDQLGEEEYGKIDGGIENGKIDGDVENGSSVDDVENGNTISEVENGSSTVSEPSTVPKDSSENPKSVVDAVIQDSAGVETIVDSLDTKDSESGKGGKENSGDMEDTMDTTHSEDTMDTTHSEDTLDTTHSEDTMDTTHSNNTTDSNPNTLDQDDSTNDNPPYTVTPKRTNTPYWNQTSFYMDLGRLYRLPFHKPSTTHPSARTVGASTPILTHALPSDEPASYQFSNAW